jgi:hypothetical protein
MSAPSPPSNEKVVTELEIQEPFIYQFEEGMQL